MSIKIIQIETNIQQGIKAQNLRRRKQYYSSSILSGVQLMKRTLRLRVFIPVCWCLLINRVQL